MNDYQSLSWDVQDQAKKNCKICGSGEEATSEPQPGQEQPAVETSALQNTAVEEKQPEPEPQQQLVQEEKPVVEE